MSYRKSCKYKKNQRETKDVWELHKIGNAKKVFKSTQDDNENAYPAGSRFGSNFSTDGWFFFILTRFPKPAATTTKQPLSSSICFLAFLFRSAFFSRCSFTLFNNPSLFSNKPPRSIGGKGISCRR